MGVSEGEELFFTHYVEYINYRLRRFFIKLVCAFAVLGFCVAGAVLYISHVSNQNHKGLCALKFSAAAQIKQTEDFIANHPEGFGGVPVSLLRRGLDGPKRTVRSLKDVNCANER